MKRLDILMAERGICESRELAQRLIMAGVVLVNGNKAQKPSQKADETAQIELEKEPPYVSRGGLKLEKALREFGIDVEGKTALDVGASTGGFTDCLLQNGAAHVYSVDVGYGQLHWKLRNDERVTVLEKTNARFLTPQILGATAQLAVMDVSFISIKLVLEAVFTCLDAGSEAVTLIKPQFEAHESKLRKGVVRDPKVHEEVLEDMTSWFAAHGFELLHLDFSPITGPKGNIEFLAHVRRGEASPTPDLPGLVARAHEVTAGTARNTLS
ncbi:MAG: TlyA family RNA methyltransferase [Eubacteriales bacterium]|nr:TlyA family RNA methyltransferase [Eubacteriales bacterium]